MIIYYMHGFYLNFCKQNLEYKELSSIYFYEIITSKTRRYVVVITKTVVFTLLCHKTTIYFLYDINCGQRV